MLALKFLFTSNAFNILLWILMIAGSILIVAIGIQKYRIQKLIKEIMEIEETK